MNKAGLIEHLKKQGYSDKIAGAFEAVRREDYVPEHLNGYAYEDMALPTHDTSTLSQPSTIAFMLKLLDLKQGQEILEIGSGSGYVLALISNIIKDGKIYGIELTTQLAVKSKKMLISDSNVEIFNRNGFQGLKDFAPYDGILVSAAANTIPSHLIHQLKLGGVLVAPVKQSIFVIKKGEHGIEEKEYPGFAFVPLLGEED